MLRRKAPPLIGITRWINTDPIDVVNLEGKVVLIDFFSYSCVNCLRTLPGMKKLHKHYKEFGLIIVGVHTPEFTFEKNSENVEDACKRLKIPWAVAVDPDAQTWEAYKNNCWPHKYLVDRDGFMIWDYKGEGGEFEVEKKIREVLGGDLPKPLWKKPIERIYGAITPETYCGRTRSAGLGSNKACDKKACEEYHIPSITSPGVLYPIGLWKHESEYLECVSEDASLLFPYSARSCNVVLEAPERMVVEVTLDGNPVPKGMFGRDIKMRDGKTVIVVDHPDLYEVVSGKNLERHKLRIKPKKKLKVFAYTFS